jgi:hypothetical protein
MKGDEPFNQLLDEVLSGGARGAAVLALATAIVASFVVLALFRRRIRRSITPDASPISTAGATQDAVQPAFDREPRPPIPWQKLNQAALRHRAGLARLYILGGVGLVIALAGVNALLNIGATGFSALWFILVVVCFSMPLALSVRLLYGRWKPAFLMLACQLVAVLALQAVVPDTPDDDPAGMALMVSLLLALMLHPRIRAMGMLATGFFTVVFTGVLVSVAGSIFLMRDSIKANIRADSRADPVRNALQSGNEQNKVSTLTDLLSDPTFVSDHALFLLKTIAVLALVGILVSVVLGAFLFRRVTKSYGRKKFSDQWLLIASGWLLLAVAVAPLTPVGVWANLGCVAVFGFTMAARLRRLPRYEGPGVRLLLLRSFTLGERSNRLFQEFESLWRSVGSIQLVGAPDIALTTLEPHELMDFLRRRSGREFVHTPADVAVRLESFDHGQDPDGRFRVNVIFCGRDETWKHAVDRMLVDSDCVLLDLRGFTRHRAGCVFEIRSLAQSDLPFRTVFLVDESTDRGLINETWASAAKYDGKRAGGESFEFVSEQPLDGTVSERIMSAFAKQESHQRASIGILPTSLN